LWLRVTVTASQHRDGGLAPQEVAQPLRRSKRLFSVHSQLRLNLHELILISLRPAQNSLMANANSLNSKGVWMPMTIAVMQRVILLPD
jgi:hypothetical protein